MGGTSSASCTSACAASARRARSTWRTRAWLATCSSLPARSASVALRGFPGACSCGIGLRCLFIGDGPQRQGVCGCLGAGTGRGQLRRGGADLLAGTAFGWSAWLSPSTPRKPTSTRTGHSRWDNGSSLRPPRRQVEPPRVVITNFDGAGSPAVEYVPEATRIARQTRRALPRRWRCLYVKSWIESPDPPAATMRSSSSTFARAEVSDFVARKILAVLDPRRAAVALPTTALAKDPAADQHFELESRSVEAAHPAGLPLGVDYVTPLHA